VRCSFGFDPNAQRPRYPLPNPSPSRLSAACRHDLHCQPVASVRLEPAHLDYHIVIASHAHGYPSHADTHHKHHFDHTTWTRIDPPEWIGEARCPQLADVLYELEDWWNDTGQHLEIEDE
jgi:streptomycin 6-kinase